MSIYEKLLNVQLEVRARKDIRNNFGNFNYRNAEQIYEAAKPVCKKHGVLLRLTDEVVEVAGKPYVMAVAEAIEVEPSGDVFAIASKGWARIPDNKKGMDDSQLTGSSSSYARKYALGGLLLLDDNKDPDSMDNGHEENKSENKFFYRVVNGKEIEVRMKDGTYKNLQDMELRWLEVMLVDPKYAEIKNFVQMYIDKVKGAK